MDHPAEFVRAPYALPGNNVLCWAQSQVSICTKLLHIPWSHINVLDGAGILPKSALLAWVITTLSTVNEWVCFCMKLKSTVLLGYGQHHPQGRESCACTLFQWSTQRHFVTPWIIWQSSKLGMLERIRPWLDAAGGGRGRSGVLSFLLQMAPKAPELALQLQLEWGMGQMEMSGQKTLQRWQRLAEISSSKGQRLGQKKWNVLLKVCALLCGAGNIWTRNRENSTVAKWARQWPFQRALTFA